MTEFKPVLLRVSEAAQIAAVGRSRAYEMAASGQWPVCKIGRSIRIPYQGLLEWIESLEKNQSERD